MAHVIVMCPDNASAVALPSAKALEWQKMHIATGKSLLMAHLDHKHPNIAFAVAMPIAEDLPWRQPAILPLCFNRLFPQHVHTHFHLYWSE